MGSEMREHCEHELARPSTSIAIKAGMVPQEPGDACGKCRGCRAYQAGAERMRERAAVVLSDAENKSEKAAHACMRRGDEDGYNVLIACALEDRAGAAAIRALDVEGE